MPKVKKKSLIADLPVELPIESLDISEEVKTLLRHHETCVFLSKFDDVAQRFGFRLRELLSAKNNEPLELALAMAFNHLPEFADLRKQHGQTWTREMNGNLVAVVDHVVGKYGLSKKDLFQKLYNERKHLSFIADYTSARAISERYRIMKKKIGESKKFETVFTDDQKELALKMISLIDHN